MNNKLPKYDKYKPSGVEWLGDIPEHWEVSRLGLLLNSVTEKNRTDLPLLSITREKGVILRDLDNEEENHNFIPDDLSNYKVLRKGQFGMNKMKAWQGSYGISNFDGIVSPAYYTFILEKNLEPAFFHISIRSKLYISFFGSASDGVRIGQWDLSRERMKQIPFLIPPIQEQTRIAEFLDRKTAQIDKAIGIKEKQIELLKERRQLMIHRAVTRGVSGQHWDSSDLGISGLASESNIPKSANQVNPDSDIYHRNQPKLKPSGVEWIGDIPEHWEVSRLGLLLNSISEKNRADLPLLSITRERGVILRDLDNEEENHNFIPDDLSNYKVLKKGEFGMNKMKAWQGSYGISNFDGIVSPAYYTFILEKNLEPAFFHISIRSKLYISFFGSASDGVRIGQWDLSRERMKQIPFLIPPIQEQKQIVTYIETLSSKIATAISLKEQEIAKLKEYKSVLINGAVTGKVKVV